ncbi:syntaxin-17-like [Artemia franciscana]|uniref:t-SNARE coiled-coil homology domain-containing protein n=1 Tax=Artemia franciscana TaxID=6661 RepID=A0AA88I8L2_ARTSF|nr:hypothetical protein QYM36_001942 [Artemia franciscana]
MSGPKSRRHKLGRFELPVKRFCEVAAPLYITLLKEEKVKIIEVFKKGHSKESLKAATKAQIACDNVRSDIREIQGLRTQMNDPKDAEEFESRINPVKESIEVEMVELAKLIRDVLVVDSQLYLESHSGAKDNVETSNGTLPLSVFEDQTLIHELEAGVERRMDQLEMHQQLERDVQDLEHIMREISRLVHDQRRNVDSVENNISIAQMNVDSGLRNVESAAKMQVAAFPIAGAVIGSCVGGPVGLLVGAKVGGLVAVGGAVVGYVSGKLVKKMQSYGIGRLP